MRHLKDFKAMISEKTVPGSIKILTRTVFVLILVLFALSGYDLGFKMTNKSTISEGVYAIYYGYLTPVLMEDVNYVVRILHMLGNYKYGINPSAAQPTTNPNETTGTAYKT